MKSIFIRKFKKNDQEAVAKFCKSIFKEMGWMELLSEDFPSVIDFLGIPSNGMFWVVKEKEDGEILGNVGLKIIEIDKGKVGLVKRFYISPILRGIGFANKLMDEVKEYAESLNLDALVLDTDNHNKRALSFYLKYGFREFNLNPHCEWEESHYPDKFHYLKYKLQKK